MSLLTRREIVSLATASVLYRASDGVAAAPSVEGALHGGSVPEALGGFARHYLEVLKAPGLIVGLASRSGTVAAAGFGSVDLAGKIPVSPAQQFHIGSITKSFVALIVLQLQEEGKLKVTDPILSHLPWLAIETDYGEISIHHLLTHTSGMPDDPQAITTERNARLRQAYKPGVRFHYSNWAFDVLGRLIGKLEGTSWPQALERRILVPLGMRDTSPAIVSWNSSRVAPSYAPRFDDRPYSPGAELATAGVLTFERSAGSIASTAHDMALYMQMLLNGGAGPSGRIVSAESFERFSTGYVDAPDFGPGVKYGYGIGVDQLEGHKRLRHTGGMPSFASAIHLDLDSGHGAFASVNAQQGSRPNPVAEYALRVLRARAEKRAPAPAPKLEDGYTLENGNEYAGRYVGPDGRALVVVARDSNLFLMSGQDAIRLRRMEGDDFTTLDKRFSLFPLVFGRAASNAAANGSSPEVVDLGYGRDWYAREGAAKQAAVPPSPELAKLDGFYHSGDALTGGAWVIQRQGKLWLDARTPLVSIGNGLFRVDDEPESPETVEFRQVIDGRAEVLVASGEVLRRVAYPHS